MSEPTALEEHLGEDPTEMMDAQDVEDLLVDCFEFVDTTIGRGLPNYLKSGAFNLRERLRRSLGWVTVH